MYFKEINMGRIILDEQGNPIWGNPQDRLNEIKFILQPHLEDIKKKIEFNDKKMYPQKLNFIPTITNLLDGYLRKKRLIRYDYAIDIDSETLYEFSNAFFDLLIFIRGYVPEYIANKQTFCAFIGFATSVFNELQNSQDGDIVAIIDNLLDSFRETNMSGAMGGTVNTTATFNRMRAKDSGYSMQLKADEQQQTANTMIVMDNDTVKKQLENVFGGKFIGKSK